MQLNSLLLYIKMTFFVCSQGGLSTSNEMCLAFLFYYPAMNLSGCMSFPNSTTLRSEMGTPDLK